MANAVDQKVVSVEEQVVVEKVQKPEVKKAKPRAKGTRKPSIVGVKDLEKEFGMTGKVIRRHLRKMVENKKPRGPEPYQWLSNDPNFKKIRENLKKISQRTSVIPPAPTPKKKSSPSK